MMDEFEKSRLEEIAVSELQKVLEKMAEIKAILSPQDFLAWKIGMMSTNLGILVVQDAPEDCVEACEIEMAAYIQQAIEQRLRESDQRKDGK
jgi:hypothetical protein